MKLVVLGSGSAVPDKHRSPSAYWLETAKSKVLLDCSASALSRMLAEDLPWNELDAIWISHFHADHCGGLLPFLSSMRHSPETEKRTKPLGIFGPRCLGDLIERLNGVNNYRLLRQAFPVNVTEVEPLEEFAVTPDINAVAMKTPHTDESLAVHLRDATDTTFVYTSDTTFTPEIAAFARRVDLLLIEAAFPNNKPAVKHLKLAEAMFIVRKADPKRVVLTHLSPDWNGIDIEKAAAEFSPMCPITAAEDGLQIIFEK
jgi:ribonuclease BN (tRNA processing enzyme)